MSNAIENKAEVSVIITAYNRTEFCMDAISSVLNQDKLATKCEIIVVKNFYKKEIDNLIRANNIISIFKDLYVSIHKTYIWLFSQNLFYSAI